MRARIISTEQKSEWHNLYKKLGAKPETSNQVGSTLHCNKIIVMVMLIMMMMMVMMVMILMMVMMVMVVMMMMVMILMMVMMVMVVMMMIMMMVMMKVMMIMKMKMTVLMMIVAMMMMVLMMMSRLTHLFYKATRVFCPHQGFVCRLRSSGYNNTRSPTFAQDSH